MEIQKVNELFLFFLIELILYMHFSAIADIEHFSMNNIKFRMSFQSGIKIYIK